MSSKKWIGLAVILVALIMAINAFAYRTASVTNDFSITVDSTNNAALAIDAPTTPDPGITATISAGKMNLTINEKVQPHSDYLFEDVLKIKNNTGYPVNLSYSFTGGASGLTVTLRRADGSALGTLPAGQSIECELLVSTSATYGGTLGAVTSGSLVIDATR
jgi:hypothetical protein